MEHRFSTKDFFIFLGLGLVLVSIWMAMYQRDREWGEIQRAISAAKELQTDMTNLERLINERLQGGGTNIGVPGTPDNHPAFERAKRTESMPGYAKGDWYVRAFGVRLKTITPMVSSDVYASIVQDRVLESLVSRNPETLEWQPLVAKAWTISQDGLVFTFTMRQNVRFSDGTPLTAEDLEFTFNFLMNEKIAAPRPRAYYEKIKSVKATSRFEVVFTYKEPYFEAFELAGNMSILPRHFYSKYLDDPEAFNQSTCILLGSGPYRLEDPVGWKADQRLILIRNERYWGPVLPAFDKLIFETIEGDAARLTAFRNGSVDGYAARPKEYQQLLADPQFMKGAKNFEFESPRDGYAYIGWNQMKEGKPTIFADRRVRQALTLLIDRERICKDVFLGYGKPAVSPFSPLVKQHDPNIKPWPCDAEKAKALLAEAKFADRDKDSILENEQGEKLEFDLIYGQGNDDWQLATAFIAAELAKQGILMRPKPVQWDYLLDSLTKKTFSACLLGWSSGFETDIYQMFHSSQMKEDGDNFISYKNPELDQLIDKARREVREDVRIPIWQQCEKIMHEDQPYTFLIRRKSLIFVDRRIANTEVLPKWGFNIDVVPLEWYVPLGMQKYK